MSARRIFYDEMRERGLIDRCGYGRNLFEIMPRGKGPYMVTKPIEDPLGRLKQGCALLNGKCIYSGELSVPTREESYSCPVYELFQNYAVAVYQASLRKKKPKKSIPKPNYSSVSTPLEKSILPLNPFGSPNAVLSEELAELIIQKIKKLR